MRIATYCITFPEEHDVIMNMVRQAKRLGDVWVVDGGPDGHLCHNPTPDLDPWVLQRMGEVEGFIYTRLSWPGNPGTQRNDALRIMEPHNYDWIIQNDSDEFWPDQMVEQIPEYLESQQESVTNIKVKVLPLVGDEGHYSPNYAHHLSHARIHRPGAVSWSETWHEHQFFEGGRIDSDLWLVHTNWLFLERLKRIKGHGLEGWDHNPVQIEALPSDRFGLTWPELDYPYVDRFCS